MFCIYLIFNKVNGKIYVGKSQDAVVRFRDHLKIARGGKEKYHGSYSYIHAALNKYGFDNFIVRVVEQDIFDEQSAFSKEKEWIELLKNGGYVIYNLTDGGDGATGHKMSEAGRKKLSEIHLGKEPWNKGKQTPDDVRDKQSASAINRFMIGIHPRRGKPSHLRGKKRSDGFGEKISKSKKGVPQSKEHTLSLSKLTEEQVKQIRALIEQGVSNKDIAALFGVHRDTISRIKNNKTWLK